MLGLEFNCDKILNNANSELTTVMKRTFVERFRIVRGIWWIFAIFRVYCKFFNFSGVFGEKTGIWELIKKSVLTKPVPRPYVIFLTLFPSFSKIFPIASNFTLQHLFSLSFQTILMKLEPLQCWNWSKPSWIDAILTYVCNYFLSNEYLTFGGCLKLVCARILCILCVLSLLTIYF